MKAVGNYLKGQENLSYAISGFLDEGSRLKCDKCQSLNSPFYFDSHLNLKKKNLDFSSTYEGANIVSEKFKRFCIGNNLENLLFTPLESADGFYHFQVLGKTAEVDIEKSKFTVGALCSICGFNTEIFGGVELFIRNKKLSGFYTTDIIWRTHFVFRPRFIVDLETTKLLKDEKFKGLYFENVYSA